METPFWITINVTAQEFRLKTEGRSVLTVFSFQSIYLSSNVSLTHLFFPRQDNFPGVPETPIRHDNFVKLNQKINVAPFCLASVNMRTKNAERFDAIALS
ncbi:MAG: hypothetical protein AUK24_09435 [Syntrophaceae bacterium CG2_30_49_12]|nr:MAG: hypothetical protein AUK24_09435 [Syntrophaceae bacterium CG2_30_49_12]